MKPALMGSDGYRRRVEEIQAAWPQDPSVAVGLRKQTSNLFRRRRDRARCYVDMTGLQGVIAIDSQRHLADVAGLTTYERAVDDLLPHGYAPAVVPELKTITVGGAIAGGGIESSSFRYGFVHETVAEMDILLADGSVVTATPDNEHADLFVGFPCTYGTLGYVLRARIRLMPARPWVVLQHEPLTEVEQVVPKLAERCRLDTDEEPADFVEAVVFDRQLAVVTTARFADEPVGAVSSYTGDAVYYQSLRQRRTDCLSVHDYLWRWDADWFWCARAFGAEHPLLRRAYRLFGCLRSSFYWKVRARLDRWGVLNWIHRNHPQEWVIQDVEVPLDGAAAFMRFFLDHIPLRPFWICPARSPAEADWRHIFPIYRTDPEVLYLNFGFWGGVPAKAEDPAWHNRRIEEEVTRLNGKKSLYSDAFYDEETFWRLYGGETYWQLKQRYDPHKRFLDLYCKAVGR